MRAMQVLGVLGVVLAVAAGCGEIDSDTADGELYDFIETTTTLLGGMPYDVYVGMMRDVGEQELAFAEADARSVALCSDAAHEELPPGDLAIVLAYCPELSPP